MPSIRRLLVIPAVASSPRAAGGTIAKSSRDPGLADLACGVRSTAPAQYMSSMEMGLRDSVGYTSPYSRRARRGRSQRSRSSRSTRTGAGRPRAAPAAEPIRTTNGKP